nr:hypothetical protein MACL_00001829 [Theileria orientalis]
MNLFQLCTVVVSLHWIFVKYFSLSVILYFMYTGSSLHGYRNRVLSNCLTHNRVKRLPVKNNLLFLSNIRTYFNEKPRNRLINTIRYVEHSKSEFSVPQTDRSSTLVRELIPNLIGPVSEKSLISKAINLNEWTQQNTESESQSRDMSENNYAIARIPEEGTKLYLTVFWNQHKLKLEREKNETIGSTIARLKRNLYKAESGRDTKNRGGYVEEESEHAVSFLTNLFKTFDEDSNCEDTIMKSSFISINGNLLKLYTNIPKLEKVKLLHTSMVDCPALVVAKDEEDKIYARVAVEWLDAEGNLLGNNLLYMPSLADLGKKIKVRVTNELMKYDVFESNLSKVEVSPFCGWQLERISSFNAAPKNRVNPELQDQEDDVRIVSFNILSPTYLSSTDSTSNFFPYCPTEYIESNYRNQLIGREINYLNPQILCLQECSAKVYSEYLSYLFGAKYHSWFTIKGGKAGEGCAMLVNRSAFEPLELAGMYFKDAMRTEEYKPVIQRLCTNWLFFNDNYFDKYHTVYQFGLYRIKSNDKFVFLANTHLYFHPMASHIRLLQTYVLLNELEKFKVAVSRKYGFDISGDSYTLICGDFNSFPNESIHTFVRKGFIPYDHPDWKLGETFVYDKNLMVPQGYRSVKGDFEEGPGPFDKHNYLIVDNYQGYTDSYAQTPLEFTNYCEVFNGTLDFIFHSNNVKVKRTMPGISAEDASEYIGLPSKLYPSDHLSIAVDF